MQILAVFHGFQFTLTLLHFTSIFLFWQTALHFRLSTKSKSNRFSSTVNGTYICINSNLLYKFHTIISNDAISIIEFYMRDSLPWILIAVFLSFIQPHLHLPHVMKHNFVLVFFFYLALHLILKRKLINNSSLVSGWIFHSINNCFDKRWYILQFKMQNMQWKA